MLQNSAPDGPKIAADGAIRPDLPPDQADMITRSRKRQGLLALDGRIAALSFPMSRDLGFESPHDLNGLHIFSLWHQDNRADVIAAFSLAQAGTAAQVHLDLTYIADIHTGALVTFAPELTQNSIIMTLGELSSESCHTYA